MPQHSRVGMTRAMTQFGEVIHCHKPPYSGIPGEDFVNVRFASQDAADRAYAALKAGQVFVDGFQVGVGPAPAAKGMDALAMGNTGGMMRRRSPSPPRRYGRNRQRSPPMSHMRRPSPPRRRSPSPPAMPTKGNFPSRNDPKSPSPRRLAREMNMSMRSRSRSRMRERRYHTNDQPTRGSEFSGSGGYLRVKDKATARSPSPDPPGPQKNLTLVKNPFFRPERLRSPSPELQEPERNVAAAPRNAYFQEAY